jgi:hypothetical protein
LQRSQLFFLALAFAADIGRAPPQKLRRQRSGKPARETMRASAPVCCSPRASLLSSERIRLSDQSGEG